ncbi:MAG: metallophosphoesterase family protein [Bacteroidales bacterium]|jgi:putative phosphoesterase|nr:metallophosphoesterase family protein [Bacteroidales bacterium]
MTRIGLLSDTHGSIHPRVFDFFKDCDIIIHAGDIGDEKTLKQLQQFKPLFAVYGNIDGSNIRIQLPEIQEFKIEDIKIFMIHIGGYPRKYARGIKEKLKLNKPDLFISGHSHILKIMHDKPLGILHINPGAAGSHGLHQKITFVRFAIDKAKILDMEIMEIDRKAVSISNDQPNE